MDRIAVIFDDRVRPETTGTYCQRALQELVRSGSLQQADHFQPDQLDAIKRDRYQAFLFVDDGLDYAVPEGLQPAAWWAIDTHVNFERCLERARQADLVFAAQRDGAEQLQAAGITAARWLPLACDPEMHGRRQVKQQHNVCFVGNLAGGERRRLLALIQQRFSSVFVGQRYFKEMAETYSASRIVFNRSLANDVNMRVFEALASGSMLLTNDLSSNGQGELFQAGRHLEIYREDQELLEKIEFYLKHDDARQRIGTAGTSEVLARHTYLHRMQTVLEAFMLHAGVPGCSIRQRRDKGKAAELEPRAVFHQTQQLCLETAPGHGRDCNGHGPESERCSPMRASARRANEGSGCLAGLQDPGYFEFQRPELLALVDRSARHVLEIGCGAGRLGQSIRARQNAEVVGVELDASAAQAASRHLDDVIVGDIEQLELDFPQGRFDCILCADVLEHLRDPRRALVRARKWLSGQGALIASIPNVRHHSVVSGLLDGNWTYEPAGLLDRTHRAFFTRQDLECLFVEAGYDIASMEVVWGPGYQEWRRLARPGTVRIGRLVLNGLADQQAEEFFVYQYLVRAQPKPQAGRAACIAGIGQTHDPQNTSSDVSNPEICSTATRKLSLLYVGDFESPGKSELYAAQALESLGHQVRRLHDASVESADHLLRVLDAGEFECLLFYKGCLGATTDQQRLFPDGQEIARVLRECRIPGYTWYFDRVYQYELNPSREAWMRLVAPLCRVAFVTDGALAGTGWANWHLLRQGVCGPHVQRVHVAESDRIDLGFLGQIYGQREKELARVAKHRPLHRISNVFGPQLNEVLRRHRIILGPRFPSIPHYWSNRLYVVLGHGGFFLAPEIEGMREEGFIAGLHYAPLSDDPLRDIEYWLARPAERERIARAGQQLVLSRFTYEHRAAELARVIEETL